MKHFHIKLGILAVLSIGTILTGEIITPLIPTKNLVTTSTNHFSPDSVMSSIFAIYLENKTSSGVSGTGFAIKYRGEIYIVTNQHVVSPKRDYYYLVSKDQKKYNAKLIYSDKDDDIAFLKLNHNDEIKALILNYNVDNDSIGQQVYTIGNPYDFLFSFSDGVISNIDRNVAFVDGDFDEMLIQTNINVNPGNSGGPLLNQNGQVIGVIASMLEDSEGISFAIPSKTILKHLKKL